MRADIIQRLGLGAMETIKQNPSFPFRTGHLKHNAIWCDFSRPNTFTIVFDTRIAPYITYLEYGVPPQMYFKPSINKMVYTRGSSRHVGFISERATQDVISYLAKQFRSENNYQVVNNEGRTYAK